MKANKRLGIIIILLVAMIFVGCQGGSNEETTDIQKFADTMTEDLLISINNKDYEEFSKNLSSTVKAQITQELFNTQILGMIDVIGEYKEGSKELLEEKEIDKNFIRVIYNTEYTNEESNVIITITFNTNAEDRKIEGFFMNSAKLQQQM